MTKTFRQIIVFLFLIFICKDAYSETKLRVVNWNVKAGSVENVLQRKAGISALKGRVPIDILVLQEINSFASVQLIAEYLGMKDSYIAVSNFGSDAKSIFLGLETAVISRVPIVAVSEYQQRFDGKLDPNGPITIDSSGEIKFRVNEDIEELIVPQDVITDSNDAEKRVSRGLLRVELKNGLIIYPIHLKSNLPSLCFNVNRGLSDTLSSLNKIKVSVPEVSEKVDVAVEAIRKLVRVDGTNKEAITRRLVQEKLPGFTEMHAATAASRENGTAALAKLVASDLKNKNVKGIIVAGDFNTPIDEPSKTGIDLKVDCMPQPMSCDTKIVPDTCGDKDGFDDTHFILSGGVVGGLKMKAMFTKAEPTHTGEDFAESPIDNIYVAGGIASKVVGARILKGSGEIAFGSDHFPLEVKVILNKD